MRVLRFDGPLSTLSTQLLIPTPVKMVNFGLPLHQARHDWASEALSFCQRIKSPKFRPRSFPPFASSLFPLCVCVCVCPNFDTGFSGAFGSDLGRK